MKRTRKGFTLVELLIVIVVIGILAAMMMLSSNEAVTSAKATTILSNLRNLKTAALAYYNDNSDYYDDQSHFVEKDLEIDAINDTVTSKIIDYLNGTNDMPDKGFYYLHIRANDEGNSGWWIVYRLGSLSGSEKDRIRSKLKGRAKSLGLVGAHNAFNTSYDTDNDTTGNVALQVR